MQYKLLPMDLESYPNYLLIGFKDTKGNYHQIDSTEGLDVMLRYLDKLVFVGYNSINYDSVLLDYVLTYYKQETWDKMARTCSKITKQIILENKSHFFIRKFYEIPNVSQHLDIAYYCGMVSLKELGIRMHHPKLETLPFKPETRLVESQIETIKEYNKNDLDITEKLLHTVKSNDVELKKHLVDSFNLPLSSYAKTDGVLAEDIICDQHKKPLKRDIIRYNAPVEFNFKTKDLQDLLSTYEGFWFTEEDKYKKQLEIFGLKIEFGVGGLHACTPNYQGERLIDIDVASYYPNIIRNYDYLPHTVKDKNQYYQMIDDRIKLKKVNKPLANAYKIVINSIFGKLNYKRSRLYDLQALYGVTITGQLLIARLCEDLCLAGYKVVYINTDGLMIEHNKELGTQYKEICKAWEAEFNYELEYTKVTRAWLRDVSNYIIEYKVEDGVDYKTKGDFQLGDDRKNNAYHRIVWKAIFEYVVNGTTIEDTITESKDICDFILYIKYGNIYQDTRIVNVDGGEDLFDKALRFYWSIENKNFATSVKSDTMGYKQYGDASNMTIVKDLANVDNPTDIDYNRYINRAYQKLGELLGQEMESNFYIETILEKLPIDKKYLSAGLGKKKLNKPLLSPDTTTINLKTGSDTEYLVLDVDYPNSNNAKSLLKWLDDEDFLIYSSEYLRADVFAGKCKYKVVYKYKGKDIPRKKKNVNIEVFYKHPVAIAGKREDGYEYAFSGEVQSITFDINDVLQESVPFNFL